MMMRFIKGISPFLLFLPLATACIASDAEVYWVDSGHINRIMKSDYVDAKWSEPQQIYQSDHPLTSLAVASNGDVEKILIWSEQKKHKTVLMQSLNGGSVGEWGQATLISDAGQSNSASVLVRISEGGFRLVWTSDRGGLDDVYVADRVGTAWGDAKKVHASNDVPDITPRAMINKEGDIELSWLRYSRNSRGYETVSKTLEIESSIGGDVASNAKLFEQELVDSQAEFPDFAKNSATAILHFPAHYYIQSTSITQSGILNPN